MGRDDCGGTKTLGRELDEAERDSTAERIADDPVDARRQRVEQYPDNLQVVARRIGAGQMAGQVDRQPLRILGEDARPVGPAAGETMQQQTAGFDGLQSVASVVLSRSISA